VFPALEPVCPALKLAFETALAKFESLPIPERFPSQPTDGCPLSERRVSNVPLFLDLLSAMLVIRGTTPRNDDNSTCHLLANECSNAAKTLGTNDSDTICAGIDYRIEQSSLGRSFLHAKPDISNAPSQIRPTRYSEFARRGSLFLLNRLITTNNNQFRMISKTEAAEVPTNRIEATRTDDSVYEFLPL